MHLDIPSCECGRIYAERGMVQMLLTRLFTMQWSKIHCCFRGKPAKKLQHRRIETKLCQTYTASPQVPDWLLELCPCGVVLAKSNPRNESQGSRLIHGKVQFFIDFLEFIVFLKPRRQ